MVAGEDRRRVGGAQLLGQQRLALEADAQRVLAQARQANIFPATLNTEVSKPNGNVSSEPRKPRHRSRSASASIPSAELHALCQRQLV